MSAEIAKKTLTLLLLIPVTAAAAWAAEIPRLTVAAPFFVEPATDKTASVSASEGPVVTVVGTTADGCNPDFAAVERDGLEIVLRGRSLQTLLPCEDEPWIRQFRLQPLPPGTYTVRVLLDELDYAVLTLVVSQARRQAVLSPGGRSHTVEVTYQDPFTGEETKAGVLPFSDEGATFWFFNPTNPEISLKILDGRGVNGHYWVFVSSLTSVEFTVRIEQCDAPGDCEVKQYHSPAGKNLDFADVTSF